VGEIVSTAEPLFWVGQRSPLQIVAEVNEEDIARVQERQKVLLRSDAFPTDSLLANVASITPKGDPIKKTFRVYLVLPAQSPLRIGMSVEANIVVREVENTLVVPSEAVANDAVFTIDKGRLIRIPVRIGLRGPRAVEVLEGPKEGTQIVSPAAGLKAGGPARAKLERAP
jgi:multidrug efflux pump subunit AcrA (membrane-fusion protein)